MKYVKMVLVFLAISLLTVPGAILFCIAYLALSIASLLAMAAGRLLGDDSSWKECFESMAHDLAFDVDPWDLWEVEEKSNVNE